MSNICGIAPIVLLMLESSVTSSSLSIVIFSATITRVQFHAEHRAGLPDRFIQPGCVGHDVQPPLGPATDAL